MTERFTVNYDITTGSYCLHDNEEAKGVDGYIAFLESEERANHLCSLLNTLHKENQQLKKEIHNKQTLLVDELRGLFKMYLTQCRSISEEAIITLIRNDVKKRVFEVFEE